MSQIITDIWPYLITALFGIIAWQWKESHAMKMKVVVLDKTVEDMQKDIEGMKKRQDSHSKKQDEIVSLITELKVEMVKQIGNMTTELGSVSSEVKSINRLLSVYDEGGKFKKKG